MDAFISCFRSTIAMRMTSTTDRYSGRVGRLSERQRADFERDGVVRLPGAFSATDAAHMREQVWNALREEYGIQPDEPATWTIGQPTGFQALTRSGAFDALGGPVLAGALDDLLGKGGWKAPKHWGSPLLRFPVGGSSWEVPGKQWHLDFPARGPTRPLFGVRILALLDAVEPRAGGTLVVTGSHELVARRVARKPAPGHSRDVRRSLMQTDPWFLHLCSDTEDADRIERFMTRGAVVDGVTVRVVELTGAPGDAFLMHPWQLHAPAPNCGTSPRLMLSHAVMRTGWAPSPDVAPPPRMF
jgi:hypothetical protein